MLSTPSLGITPPTPAVLAWARSLSTPSLGITHNRSNRLFGYIPSFNSLSRDHKLEDIISREKLSKFLAFNSLSRDHSNKAYRGRGILSGAFQLPLSGSPALQSTQVLTVPANAFNSLSRDHRAQFRDFPALRGVLPRHLFAQMIPKTTI